jgi:hypothetical protein
VLAEALDVLNAVMNHWVFVCWQATNGRHWFGVLLNYLYCSQRATVVQLVAEGRRLVSQTTVLHSLHASLLSQNHNHLCQQPHWKRIWDKQVCCNRSPLVWCISRFQRIRHVQFNTIPFLVLLLGSNVLFKAHRYHTSRSYDSLAIVIKSGDA